MALNLELFCYLCAQIMLYEGMKIKFGLLVLAWVVSLVPADAQQMIGRRMIESERRKEQPETAVIGFQPDRIQPTVIYRKRISIVF